MGNVQLWPFTSYNWLFLWDYTFYKRGYTFYKWDYTFYKWNNTFYKWGLFSTYNCYMAITVWHCGSDQSTKNLQGMFWG
jgi:hypothetical protein